MSDSALDARDGVHSAALVKRVGPLSLISGTAL